MKTQKVTINVSNAERREATSRKLGAWIDEVQARSRARNITVDWVLEALADVSSKLKAYGCTLRSLEGATVSMDLNAQDFPASYTDRGSPMSTHVAAELHNGKWVVYSVYRYQTRRARDRYAVDLPAAAREAVLATASKLHL